MMRLHVVARAAALVAVACVLTFAAVSSAHVHGQATDGTVSGLCQLCSLGQARIDLGAILPGVCTLVFLGWLILPSCIQAPARQISYSPSPRAPPLR